MVHHAFRHPTPAPTRSGPPVYIPRATVPGSLRRPSLVIVRDGTPEVSDSHRWSGALESMLPEALGTRITAHSGIPCRTHEPAEKHATLHIELLSFDVIGGSARMRLRCRLETPGSTEGRVTDHEWLTPLKDDGASGFVSSQSSNLDLAASALSTAILEAR